MVCAHCTISVSCTWDYFKCKHLGSKIVFLFQSFLDHTIINLLMCVVYVKAKRVRIRDEETGLPLVIIFTEKHNSITMDVQATV